MATPLIKLDSVNRLDRKPAYFGKERQRYLAKPRLYIEPTDWNVNEDLFEGGRFNRPHIDFKRHLLADTLTQAGLDPTQIKASWSQTAGCRCGCSPGFILTGATTQFDIWAKYKYVPVENTTDTPT